ncbi:radical SAM protein [Bacillota bacterium LX-D]|nr:radical SAM protein [Bacillota bacterium LX-D]
MLVSWNVTQKCNLSCKHCYRESGPDINTRNELSTEEGLELITGIAQAGFKRLIFSGGEPLLRNDLYELICCANNNNLITALGTNGTLITKEVAKELKKVQVKAVAISLDNLEAEKHDQFRQISGSWNKAMRGIQNCLSEGIKLQINTTVTRTNYEQISEMMEFVSQIGGKAHHLFFLVNVGRGRELKEEVLNKEQYRQMLEIIVNMKKNLNIELKPTCAPQFMVEAQKKYINMHYSRGCIAGISYCCILPNGDVHICPYLPLKVGSVRITPFKILWLHNEIFKQLRDFSNYKGKCGKCLYNQLCGGCRARAYYDTGDFLQEDHWCLEEIVHG